jgi:hypothetical protein
MKKFRYQPFVIEAVIKRGKKEFDEPRAERDVDGLYNSLVTLTDLSRRIIQAPPYKAQIATFATEVKREIPSLKNTAKILIKRHNTIPPDRGKANSYQQHEMVARFWPQVTGKIHPLKQSGKLRVHAASPSSRPAKLSYRTHRASSANPSGCAPARRG